MARIEPSTHKETSRHPRQLPRKGTVPQAGAPKCMLLLDGQKLRLIGKLIGKTKRMQTPIQKVNLKSQQNRDKKSYQG